MVANLEISSDSIAQAVGTLTLERQKEIEEQHRISEIQSITLLDLAARPDQGGTLGRKIPLKTNLFALNLGKGGPSVSAPSRGGAKSGRARPLPVDLLIFHYDTVIEPFSENAPAQPLTGRAAAARNERKLPISLLRETYNLALSDAVADPNNPLQKDHVASIAFDGRRNAYTPRRLPFDGEFSWVIALPKKEAAPGDTSSRDAGRKFKITMTLVKEIDASTLLNFCAADTDIIRATGISVPEIVTNSIQALQVLLCHDPATKYKVHGAGGRRFFNPEHAVNIPGGAAIWKGFFQSVRPTGSGMVVNIDAAFAAFLRSGNMIDVSAAILGLDGSAGGSGFRGGRGGDRGGFRGDRGGRGAPRGRGGPPGGGHGGGGAATLTNLRPMQVQELRKRFKNAKLRPTHRQTSRLETFKGFSARPAREETFEKDGRRIKVLDYFKTQYGITVKYPDLPLVETGGGGKIPMECLEVQPVALPPRKLSPAMTAAMIDESRQRPSEKAKTVQNWRNELAFESSPRLASWGITVAGTPLEVEGRVLNPPQVTYAKGSARPSVASGGWNLRNAKFCIPGTPLTTWCFINFTRTPPQACVEFARVFTAHLRELGMTVNKPPHMDQGPPSPDGVKAVFERAGKAAKVIAGGPSAPPPQLFVCLVDGDADLYAAIKRVAICDLPSPVASQCMLARKALSERGQAQYAANVAMKVNVKLGGFNHAIENQNDLPSLGGQTMIMGADCSHGPPGSSQLSIAACVATLDGKRSKYHAEIRAQRHSRGGKSQETILNMKEMALQHLKHWADLNKGQLPASIIMFRDGVSEGQWAMARQFEAQAIQDAVHALQPRKTIPLTYVVCMKRHHVRFMAKNESDTDRSGNLPAGTVVDTKVVHPYGFEFYLQAHAGLIGTARPTRYVVLQNDAKFTSDNLQRIVNSLSYTYSRATRSVSLVPPAYYADILAEKGRILMYHDALSETATSYSDTTTSALQRESELGEPDSGQLMRSIDRSKAFASTQWYM